MGLRRGQVTPKISLGQIPVDAAPLGIDDAQRVLGLGQALCGGPAVPLTGLDRVGFDALASRKGRADKGLGPGIAMPG